MPRPQAVEAAEEEAVHVFVRGVRPLRAAERRVTVSAAGTDGRRTLAILFVGERRGARTACPAATSAVSKPRKKNPAIVPRLKRSSQHSSVSVRVRLRLPASSKSNFRSLNLEPP